MASTTSLLQIADVSKYFGAVQALDGVSLDVSGGEIFGLIGPNGSGKTTLFNCVTGFHQPSAGSIKWVGVDVTGERPNRLVARGLARTFQQVMTFPSQTVVRNVATAGEAASGGNESTDLPTDASGILEFCGLTRVAMKEAGDLSYGQARTLGVAMALATRPRLLMLDEPASGLNDFESRQLADLLRALNEQGLTLLVIDHDMSFLLPLVHRVAVLDVGRKLTEGSPDEVREDPRVIEAYLGQGFEQRRTIRDPMREERGEPSGAPTLEVRALRAGYGGPDAIEDVSLTVAPSESVAILGANGAGKTTLIRALSGVLPLTAGEVRYGSVRFGDTSLDDGARSSLSSSARRVARRVFAPDGGHERALFNAGLVHVPEERHVFTGMTVRDNLLVAARPSAGERPDDLLAEVLEIFPDLRDRLELRGGTLSGGQQQMLAIGRGLMSRPRLLCLDEPSLGLAPALMETLTDSIASLKRSSGMSLLIVEQSAPMALELADRVYVMQNGRIVQHADAIDISIEQLTAGYFGGPAMGSLDA